MDNIIHGNAQVITIDGPGGSGKGTISRLLAHELKWHILESGALYRLLALCAQKHQIGLDNIAALTALAETLDVQFIYDDLHGITRFMLEGEDVTLALGDESCGNKASQISVYLSVRQALLGRQRSFRQMPGLVAEGRDMGTVIFPDAFLKIFLFASPETRAQRRHKQLKQQGIHVTLAMLEMQIAERDARDEERLVSPLVPATDAVSIDTTGMAVEAVLESILELVHQRLPAFGVSE